MSTKFMLKQSDNVKRKAIDYINTYFPEIMPDIEDYAKYNNADVGDIAAITIQDIIVPTLRPSMIERVVLWFVNKFGGYKP